MATIDVTPILGSGSYDDVTGQFTGLTLPTGLANKEAVTLAILELIETQAQNKRSNLNFPISEKAFPDEPSYSYVSRSDNAATPVTETQIERSFQFVGWYVAPAVSASNAVNDAD